MSAVYERARSGFVCEYTDDPQGPHHKMAAVWCKKPAKWALVGNPYGCRGAGSGMDPCFVCDEHLPARKYEPKTDECSKPYCHFGGGHARQQKPATHLYDALGGQWTCFHADGSSHYLKAGEPIPVCDSCGLFEDRRLPLPSVESSDKSGDLGIDPEKYEVVWE